MTTDGRESFLNRNGARLLFLLVILCAAFSVILASRVRLEDTLLRHTAPMIFTEGWVEETEDGRAGGGAASIVNTLPENIGDGVWLCFQTKNESVVIRVGGEVIYTYGETPQLIFGHGVGAVWNMAQLPADSGGKTIEIRCTPVDQRTGLEPYRFLIGGYNSIITYLLREKTMELAVSVVLAVIGLGSLIMSAVGLLKRRRWADAIFSFSLFVLLSAVWTVTDSGLTQFVFHNKGGRTCCSAALFICFVRPLRFLWQELSRGTGASTASWPQSAQPMLFCASCCMWPE